MVATEYIFVVKSAAFLPKDNSSPYPQLKQELNGPQCTYLLHKFFSYNSFTIHISE